MALLLHSSSTLLPKNPRLLLLPPHSPTKSTSPFIVRSQDSSSAEPPKPTTTTAQPIDGSSSDPDPPKKPTSTGLGFGSSSSSISKSKANPVSTKKKQKGRQERDSIIRRKPVEKPDLLSPREEGRTEEQLRNENAFLLTWLGLGAVILLEGIALAASGFLPEEWDSFFVKYLYPAFTPTVFLFVAGTVAYGVIKYLQNEKPKSQK